MGIDEESVRVAEDGVRESALTTLRDFYTQSKTAIEQPILPIVHTIITIVHSAFHVFLAFLALYALFAVDAPTLVQLRSWLIPLMVIEILSLVARFFLGFLWHAFTRAYTGTKEGEPVVWKNAKIHTMTDSTLLFHIGMFMFVTLSMWTVCWEVEATPGQALVMFSNAYMRFKFAMLLLMSQGVFSTLGLTVHWQYYLYANTYIHLVLSYGGRGNAFFYKAGMGAEVDKFTESLNNLSNSSNVEATLNKNAERRFPHFGARWPYNMYQQVPAQQE